MSRNPAERLADAARVVAREGAKVVALVGAADDLVGAVVAYGEAKTHKQRDAAFVRVLMAGAAFLRALRPHLPPPARRVVTAAVAGIEPATG